MRGENGFHGKKESNEVHKCRSMRGKGLRRERKISCFFCFLFRFGILGGLDFVCVGLAG